MKKLLPIIIVLILIGGGYYAWSQGTSLEPKEDIVTLPVYEAHFDKYIAPLSDVTNGSFINGFTTQSLAKGSAEASYKEGTYTLSVSMEGLAHLTSDFFYEGWVVRKGDNLSVVSTGEAFLQADGSYMNRFESDADLTDHTTYVLTLEPRDDDPSPADHILDGQFSPE